MTTARYLVPMLLLLALALGACNGGGRTPSEAVVNGVNFNPAAPVAGSLVQLTGNISGGSGAVTKQWSVSSGSLSVEPPDFALLLRSTARAASSLTLNTTANTVYWLAPADGGGATVTLTIGESSKTRTLSLGASPLSLSVTDIAGGGKRVDVLANDVDDLYQAAFRVTFSSAWSPKSTTAGEFLGTSNQTLFFGLTNQNGFVPVAVTRRGNIGGVDGTGVLARIEFEPASGTSGARQGSAAVPFDLQMVVLRTAGGEQIDF